MRKLFFIFFFLPSVLYAKQVAFDIPDNDIKIVENDVFDAIEWLENAWKGKVESCGDRIVKEELNLSITNNESLPAGKDAIIEKYFNRPGYKSRKEKEGKSN